MTGEVYLIFCDDIHSGYALKIQGRDGVRKFKNLEEAVAVVRREAGREGGQLLILDAMGKTMASVPV